LLHGTWLITARDITHSYVIIGATRDMTHSCVIIIATRLTHTWHHSFMCDSHCHTIPSEKTPGNIRVIFAKEPNKHRVLFEKRCTIQETQHIVATRHPCLQHRDPYHIPCEWIMSHMNESRPIWMSHVPHEWVMSHMNEYAIPCCSFFWHKSRTKIGFFFQKHPSNFGSLLMMCVRACMCVCAWVRVCVCVCSCVRKLVLFSKTT